jgi:DNA-binding response OmpR family regulator
MTGKVLIVDDEPDIRELLEITLGRMSLITESASTMASAMNLLSTRRFDLCLTDMRLPDGDGLRLVEFIQRQLGHMPVAVITAHGNTETAIRALKSGAFDFLSKPVDLQKLRDLVTAAIKLSAQQTVAIAAAAGANVAMGIDESRHEHLTGDIVDFGARGNRNFVGRADGDNLAARDDEHAVGDGRPAHRNNLGADKDLRFLLGVNSSG